MSAVITNQQIEKIGNAIIYLSKKVSELNKTKIQKLLFFIEETSIAKFGCPFFGVDFKLWVRGPVLEDVYNDLEQPTPILFKDYIKRADYNKELFEANGEFNDDEFSNNDIVVLDAIAKLAKHKVAGDLVMLSHAPGSLWEKSAVKYDVFFDLENEKISRTNYVIDFSLLFENDDFRREQYENAKENIEAINSLK
jgi:uncharacterized phage-associated protein